MSQYSVSVVSTPMPWPLGFAAHTWFVIEKDSSLDRYEVWAVLGRLTGETVVVNGVAPFEGFRTSFLYDVQNPKKKGKTAELFKITGDEESLAARLYEAVVKSRENYEYLGEYVMWPGLNSNTYVASVLRKFPEVTWELPWRAIGKNYKKKSKG